MANSFKYKGKEFGIGDTISFDYLIKEGEKTRKQLFRGILIKVRGDSEVNRMFTIRKITKIGIGVERIMPLSSPLISDLKVVKKAKFRKAKAYFIRNLSEKEFKKKLYHHK